MALLAVPAIAAVGDIDNDGIPDAEESALAQKYAPVLVFAKGERLYPVAVEYFLENSDLKQAAMGDSAVKGAPLSAGDISGYTSPLQEFYLDSKLGGIEGEKIIEAYEAKKAGLGYTVYARVAANDLSKMAGNRVIQYYFFYVFNPGRLNRHEGDWEMVQVELGQNNEPLYAAYSQHEGGERAAWGLVEKKGDHPVVYVALGSHANYLRPFEGAIGLASDRVGGDGLVLGPEQYSLETLGEKGAGNHSAAQGWLDFAGYWGEYGGLEAGATGQRGPRGPVYREDGQTWDMPAAWSAGKMEATGEWFTINWVVYNFVLLFLLYIAVRIAIKGIMIAKTAKTKGLGPRVFSLLYIDGLNAKSLGNILCIVSIIIALLALFQPWYYINANIEVLGISTGGTTTIVLIDGFNGVLVNWFLGNGVTQMFGLGIPFSVLLGLGFLVFALATIGISNTSIAGRKYILRGIMNAVPVIVLLVVVMQLTGIVDSVAPVLSNQMPPQALGEAQDVFEAIGGSPFGGSFSKSLDYGIPGRQSIDFSWGMGTGAYMLLVSAVLGVIAGFLEITARATLFERRK